MVINVKPVTKKSITVLFVLKEESTHQVVIVQPVNTKKLKQKNVLNVNSNVIIVHLKKSVPNVKETDLQFQAAHVQPELMKPSKKNVQIVTTNVPLVSPKPLTVLLVPLTESPNQFVLAQLELTMLTMLPNVQIVMKNVKLVSKNLITVSPVPEI